MRGNVYSTMEAPRIYYFDLQTIREKRLKFLLPYFVLALDITNITTIERLIFHIKIKLGWRMQKNDW